MSGVPAGDRPPRVALVLAGGGARGAYEIGALSILLPHLERRGERPDVIVGTSVGAINAAHLAATAADPLSRSLERGFRLWSEIGFDDVLRPLVSVSELARALGSFGELLGLPGARLWSLLDPSPLARTLRARVPFERIRANVASGELSAAAVVATSARSGDSVVFHDGGGRPAADRQPRVAGGWYFDGGTRLNTPIKPALALGAERIVVIALNSLRSRGPRGRPEALDGAAQLAQAVLVDPLVNDVRTLATINTVLRTRGAGADGGGRRRSRTSHRPIPYIFVAPEQPSEIGAIAARVYREHYAGLLDQARSPSIALLGRAFNAGQGPARGELFSYLFFAREFAEALMRRGREDARRWLDRRHDEGPWRLGKPPR
jgi:NTE family protein